MSRLVWTIQTALGLSILALLSGLNCLAQKQTSLRDQEILRIQQLIEARAFNSAHSELAEALKRHPEDEGFENLLGIVEAQEGNYAAAEASFQSAVAKSPNFTGAYLNLGRLYQEHAQKDPEALLKALDVYGRVLAYEPGNSEAHYQSASLLLRQHKYQESLNHLSLLPSEFAGTARVLAIQCNDYAGLQNFSETTNTALRLAASPDRSELDVQQALLGLMPANRDDLIIPLLESLRKRQPLSSESLETLGLAYNRANRLPQARATLEAAFATARNGSSFELLWNLARVAHRQRDYQGALGYLAHARDLQPANAAVHYYFGLICIDLNLIAEARDSFEKAVQLEPENPEYNYAMGAASAFRHDPAEAVPYFEKYLQLKPQDPRGKLALGAAYFRAKDYERALPWLMQSANIPLTSTRSHYYLGKIALHDGQFERALAELQQALKAKPDFADALAEMGQYYIVQRDYAEAEKWLQHALAVAPDHYLANFYLLTLYTRTKDQRQAAQAKRFDELKKLMDERTQEFLRIVDVRPFESP
jgi:tetratricopeptide (TPR) repeat protein